MVRPCVLRHRVTVLTLCPLGEPEIAIGHEPRIEPWLPRNRIACQVSRVDGRCHHSKNEPRERKSDPEAYLQTVGWISRQKNFSATSRRRSFFVDIPFYRTTYLISRLMVRSGFLDIYPRPGQDCGRVGPHRRRASRMRPVAWFKCARPNAETVIQNRWVIAPRWETVSGTLTEGFASSILSR